MKDGDTSRSTHELTDLLDHARWSRARIGIVVLVALAVVFDGLDTQAIGLALPVLIKAWGHSRQDFTPVLAVALVGMAVGAIFGGRAGDHFGRRPALIASVALFGIVTVATSLATNLDNLLALRLLASLGMGAAVPNATTLVAEFTPLRHRALAVTGTIVCFPLGGIVGGAFGSLVLPGGHWGALFVFGGCCAVVLALVLAWAMPESPLYLAPRPARAGELTALLRRLMPGTDVPAVFHDEALAARRGLASLFRHGYGRDTLALWLAYFSGLLAIYLVFNWLPTLLTGTGFGIRFASVSLAAYNLGGVFGAILCALVMIYTGSRSAMILTAAGAVVSAAVLALIHVAPDAGAALLIVVLTLQGLFINAVQSTLYALAAHVYPAPVRATGMGAASALGRMGAIVSSFAGTAAISAGGSPTYFGLIAVSSGVALVGIALVHRHIPRTANTAIAP